MTVTDPREVALSESAVALSTKSNISHHPLIDASTLLFIGLM